MPKSLQIDLDNLRMKFSASDVIFTGLKFGPCVQGILHMMASNLFKMRAFGRSNDISRARPVTLLAYVNERMNESHCVQIAEIGELRFCSQWAVKHAPLSCISLCVSWAFLFLSSGTGPLLINAWTTRALCLLSNGALGWK